MITATPTMKPVMIGTESRSAIQPSRSRPIASTIAPVTSAVREREGDRFWRPGDREVGDRGSEQRRDRGVGADGDDLAGSEEEEGDRGGNEGPNAVAAGIPARREVASCSGTAITRSVRPGNHVPRYPRALVAAHRRSRAAGASDNHRSGCRPAPETGDPGRPLLLSDAGVIRRPAARLQLMPIWLTADEMRKLEAVVDRLIPAGGGGPGGARRRSCRIHRRIPRRIPRGSAPHLGGRHRHRGASAGPNGLPDLPRSERPRRAVLADPDRGIARHPRTGVQRSCRGLQQVTARVLRALGDDFPACGPEERDVELRADREFTHMVFVHVCEGTYGAPGVRREQGPVRLGQRSTSPVTSNHEVGPTQKCRAMTVDAVDRRVGSRRGDSRRGSHRSRLVCGDHGERPEPPDRSRKIPAISSPTIPTTRSSSSTDTSSDRTPSSSRRLSVPEQKRVITATSVRSTRSLRLSVAEVCTPTGRRHVSGRRTSGCCRSSAARGRGCRGLAARLRRARAVLRRGSKRGIGVAGLAGANPFAAWRSGPFPMPPGASMYGAVLSAAAASGSDIPVSHADGCELDPLRRQARVQQLWFLRILRLPDPCKG